MSSWNFFACIAMIVVARLDEDDDVDDEQKPAFRVWIIIGFDVVVVNLIPLRVCMLIPTANCVYPTTRTST